VCLPHCCYPPTDVSVSGAREGDATHLCSRSCDLLSYSISNQLFPPDPFLPDPPPVGMLGFLFQYWKFVVYISAPQSLAFPRTCAFLPSFLGVRTERGVVLYVPDAAGQVTIRVCLMGVCNNNYALCR
jgi:hypothetical protein